MKANETKREIVEMDIDAVIPYELNARVHRPEQIMHIADSIREFGFNQPLS